MKLDYKSGFVSGTLKQVSGLIKPLQFENMETKLEALTILLTTATQTIEDLKLQIETNRRAKARTQTLIMKNSARGGGRQHGAGAVEGLNREAEVERRRPAEFAHRVGHLLPRREPVVLLTSGVGHGAAHAHRRRCRAQRRAAGNRVIDDD